jgi:hypothetical protein
MRTIAKLLPLFVIALLSVVFPVWSQESQQEQTSDQQTTNSTEQTEQATTSSTPEAEQATTSEASSDEVSTSIDSAISVWTSHADKDSSKAEEYGEIPD